MATIKVRKQANGSTRYTAIVRVRRGKTVIYRESSTFAFRAAACLWAKHREVELEKPSALELTQRGGILARPIRRSTRILAVEPIEKDKRPCVAQVTTHGMLIEPGETVFRSRVFRNYDVIR
jgi:hypothetical protein